MLLSNNARVRGASTITKYARRASHYTRYVEIPESTGNIRKHFEFFLFREYSNRAKPGISRCKGHQPCPRSRRCSVHLLPSLRKQAYFRNVLSSPISYSQLSLLDSAKMTILLVFSGNMASLTKF